eukprot:1231579-Rhodomonas_salina.1
MPDLIQYLRHDSFVLRLRAGSTIPDLSTINRVVPYAISVPDVRLCTPSQYRTSHRSHVGWYSAKRFLSTGYRIACAQAAIPPYASSVPDFATGLLVAIRYLSTGLLVAIRDLSTGLRAAHAWYPVPDFA